MNKDTLDLSAKISIDEIFKYQDLLTECKNFDELYNLCDELLWELECRVPISNELKSELDELHLRVDELDYSDFVELK